MTTATATLAEFLLARIAEMEDVARAVQEAEPKSAAPVFTSLHAPTGTVEMSPARVLADCEAHRRIVELHYPVPASDIDWTDCGTCPSSVSGGWPCPTLRALALPFADHPDYHPDYRPEWRP